MPKLKISTSGDEYSREAQILMWDDIHILDRCPECSAIDSMTDGPSHGRALNSICSSCKTVFWNSPIRRFGAYPVARDLTPQLPGTRAIAFLGDTEAFKET